MNESHEDSMSYMDGNYTAEFTFLGALTLNGPRMKKFWEIWVSTLLWMTISFMLVHIVAAIVALVQLRNHKYAVFIALSIVFVAFLGPATAGASITATMALATERGIKEVLPWQCAMMGILVSTLLLAFSFSRTLATL